MSTTRIPKDSAIPIFSVSRERKARIYDGLAVTLLLCLMAALGVVTFAATAKADVDGAARAYAAEYGPAVCSTLDSYHPPTFSVLMGIMLAINADGLTPYQAGEAVGLSVAELCPQYDGLLERFAATYGTTGHVA